MTESPVFTAKFNSLHSRGFELCGVLMADASHPPRFVGMTQHGKVIWWPYNVPKPHALVDRINVHRQAVIEQETKFDETSDLLAEAAAEILVLAKTVDILLGRLAAPSTGDE